MKQSQQPQPDVSDFKKTDFKTKKTFQTIMASKVKKTLTGCFFARNQFWKFMTWRYETNKFDYSFFRFLHCEDSLARNGMIDIQTELTLGILAHSIQILMEETFALVTFFMETLMKEFKLPENEEKLPSYRKISRLKTPSEMSNNRRFDSSPQAIDFLFEYCCTLV